MDAILHLTYLMNRNINPDYKQIKGRKNMNKTLLLVLTAALSTSAFGETRFQGTIPTATVYETRPTVEKFTSITPSVAHSEVAIAVTSLETAGHYALARNLTDLSRRSTNNWEANGKVRYLATVIKEAAYKAEFTSAKIHLGKAVQALKTHVELTKLNLTLQPIAYRVRNVLGNADKLAVVALSNEPNINIQLYSEFMSRIAAIPSVLVDFVSEAIEFDTWAASVGVDLEETSKCGA